MPEYTRRKKKKGSISGSEIPIALIVSFYGGEVKEGRNVSVRCCMHNDSRRSAVMDTYNNLLFCHTCGKGGTAIDVIMEKEGLGIKDAFERADEILSGSGESLQSSSRRKNSRVSRRTWNL